MTETSNKYQVMPPLSDEEYQALKEDMAENGMLVPVVQDTDGNIIDGHHRVRAYQELVAEGRAAGGFPTVERGGLTTDEKRDLAWRLNMQRRHLNREQKWEAIERKLRESPEWADNRIAKLLGVDGKTVRLARVQLEGRKEIAKLKKLVGTDGKEYPRELENKYKDMGLNPTFVKGLAQAAVPDDAPANPREPGVIEQLQASAEGREAFAQINSELAEGQARDRVLSRISDLYFLVRKVRAEDVARDVMARHVGEAAENAVLGRAPSSRNSDLEHAQEVHAWLGEFLRVLEDANAHLREVSGKE